jgi:Fe-S oxidoreductase
MARYKSEFLASYWAAHGTPWRARLFGAIGSLSRWGSRFAPIANWAMKNQAARYLTECLIRLDRRRSFPQWSRGTFAEWSGSRPPLASHAPVLLFNDTFTNYFDPEIGIAAVQVLAAAGLEARVLPYQCCGRPAISQGLLQQARQQAQATTEKLYPAAAQGTRIIFCEPSCLSAVREDAPSLLRGKERERAQVVADQTMLFEEFLEQELRASRAKLDLKPGPRTLLLHGHCHQKSMGLLAPALGLLARIPDVKVTDLDAGCCGMAGSFGYLREHYDVSRQIGERKLFPAVRAANHETAIVAAGTSCRHQMRDFTGRVAMHPAVLLRNHLRAESR